MGRNALVLVLALAVVVLGVALLVQNAPTSTAVSTDQGTRVEAPGTKVESNDSGTRIQAPGVDITVPGKKDGD